MAWSVRVPHGSFRGIGGLLGLGESMVGSSVVPDPLFKDVGQCVAAALSSNSDWDVEIGMVGCFLVLGNYLVDL